MLWTRAQKEQKDFKNSKENHRMIAGISWLRLIGKVTMDDNCLTIIQSSSLSS